MDVDAIISLVNGTGFPIVACIGMFGLYVKMLPILTEIKTLLYHLNKEVNEDED